MVEKVVRNGQVAVIISLGYGAGWSTWADTKENEYVLMFHPKLVELIESGKIRKMTSGDLRSWMASELGIIEDVYIGGYEGLNIRWIPQGTKFKVEEYDGAEYIITEADLPYMA